MERDSGVRLILIKLCPEQANANGRADVATKLRASLSKLDTSGGLDILEPGNALAEGSWDLAVLLRGPSASDVEAAVSKPDVTRFLDELGRTSDCVKGWTFKCM